MRYLVFILLILSLAANAVTLHDKQAAFAHLLPKLIQKAEELGNEVTLGEAWRSEVVAQWYADHGLGISNSLHTKRLAIDMNLFRDGKFLTRTEDYKALGEWWELQSTKDYRCTWGGRFPHRPDGNHFSIEHEGVRSYGPEIPKMAGRRKP